MPTPTPAVILPISIIGMPLAKLWHAPPKKNIIEPYKIVFFLPIISPTLPTTRDEQNAPISRIATMVPTSAREGWLK